MLVLNEKMWTPKPPWLVCRDRVYRRHLPPQGVTANCTQMWLPAPCMPVRMAGVLFSLKKVVCSPFPASRSHGIAIHSRGRPRTGHLSDFSTTVNLPLNPTILGSLKCKEPRRVYEPMCYLFIFRLPTTFMSIWDECLNFVNIVHFVNQ